MEANEAKEIIRAGLAFANWTEKQKEAFRFAHAAINKAEYLEHQMNRFEYLASYEYSYQLENVKGNNGKYQAGALEGMKNYNRKWQEATEREIKSLW